jgi:hypothetical protein
LRKWLKNNRAISSAALVFVLIVATLIFTIAAATCAGALTFTFIAYEQVSLSKFVWEPNNACCQFTVENTGTANLSILAIRINGVAPKSVNPSLMVPYALDKGASIVFTLTPADNLIHEDSYQFSVITTKGNSFSCCVKSA